MRLSWSWPMALLTAGVVLGGGLLAGRLRHERVEAGRVVPGLPSVSFAMGPSTLLGVSAFDWDPETESLLVLDPFSRQVVGLRFEGGQWRERRRFGREGEGPGEFRFPMDLLLLPEAGELAVLDRDQRVNVFTPEGDPKRTEALQIPCRLGMGMLVHRAPGRYWIAGNCVFPPPGADTMFVVLLEEGPGGRWDVAARQTRFTLDGAFGTALGPQRPAASNGAMAFLGSGNGLCLLAVGAGDGPGTRRDPFCFSGGSFSAPQPRDFSVGGLPRARAFQWPDPLPAFHAAGATPEHLYFVRMFGADSVVVERHSIQDPGAGGVQLAVEAFQGLVGCRRAGCLWFRSGEAGNEVGWFPFREPTG